MKYYIALIAIVLSLNCQASHIFSGFISCEQIKEYEYEFTVTIYSEYDDEINRDKVFVAVNESWNEGDSATRMNGESDSLTGKYLGEIFPGGIRKSEYVYRHEFLASGLYTISVTDHSLKADILNIHSSEDQVMHLEMSLLVSPLFVDYSFTPRISEGKLEMIFGEYNRLALPVHDEEGDSLTYELLYSHDDIQSELNIPAYMGYFIPKELSIDNKGRLVWDAPKLIGEWMILVRISEKKEGLITSSQVFPVLISVNSRKEEKLNLTMQYTPAPEWIHEIGWGYYIEDGEDFEVMISLADSSDSVSVEELAISLNNLPQENIEDSVVQVNDTLIYGVQSHRKCLVAPVVAQLEYRQDIIQEQLYFVYYNEEKCSLEEVVGNEGLNSVRGQRLSTELIRQAYRFKVLGVEYALYDNNGVIIEKATSKGGESLDFANYSEGMYYLLLKTEKGVFTQKLIKI